MATKRNTLIDEETLLGSKLGQFVRIVPKGDGPSARGKLIDLDENNLVILVSTGFEEVFRRAAIIAVRPITRNSVE